MHANVPALRPVAAVALLLALAWPAAAQGHEHAPASGIVIAHDVPADGRTYAGNLNHFAVLDVGDDLVPDFHQDNHVRVSWNRLVLYETTPDSGHDYDGIHAFDIVFPGAGTYEVAVLDAAGATLHSFLGYVVEPKADSGATLHLEAPDQATVGQPVTLTFSTQDDSGLVKHSDALLEIVRGQETVFRTKTHTHDEPQQVDYAFAQPGTYTVRVTNFLSFPSGNEANDFAPSTVEHQLTVSAGATMPTPVLGQGTPPADLNAVVLGTTGGGDLLLIGTYDPYTQVGTNTLQHLSALVMDPATGQAVQHVDFTASLAGPLGTVFASDTLHEYDGLLEVANLAALPGLYTLVVDAERGDWSGHLELPYVVLPPAVPVALDVPPQPAAVAATVTVDGLGAATAGVPLPLTLSARGATGQPMPHSEIDLSLLAADGSPVLLTKLHTHGDGDFPFTLTLPHAGDYTLRLSAFPLDPQAVVLAGTAEVAFTAAAGPGLPAPEAAAASQGAQQSPAPALGVLLLGLACVLAVRRRQA